MTPADLAAWIPVAPWAVGVVGVLIVLGIVLKWVVTSVAPVVRRFNHFLDDFLGQPERPGREAQPGMMQRMANQDAVIDRLVDSVALVSGEFKTNHGSTVKDDLKQIQASVSALSRRFDDHVAATGTVPVVTNVIEYAKEV